MNNRSTQKGLITGCAMIVSVLFFLYVLKFPVNSQEQYGAYALCTAGVIWSLLSFKKITGGNAKFKNYFSEGFKTFIVITLLMVIFTFVYFKFNTDYRDAGIAANNAYLVKEGNHTPAEIEENANQLRKIFMPMMLGFATFRYLILGSLITLVGAGFLSVKRENV